MILGKSLLTFVLAQANSVSLFLDLQLKECTRSITNIKQLKHQILLETEKELIEELCKIKDSIKAQKIETKVCLLLAILAYV
jgi:hypothetical protein